MVQWQDRGFVGDSDDEEEFFDLEVDHIDAAPSIASTQVDAEGSQQVTQAVTNASQHAQLATEGENGEHSAGNDVDQSSQRSTFVDARSVQSSPPDTEHNTPITSPSTRAAVQEATHSSKPHTLDLFDIPSSPLTELDSQSPIGPSGFTPPLGDPPSFALPRVVVNIPSLNIEEEDLSGFDNVQAVEEYLDRGENAGRAFRPRTAIQLHPYLLESEQYRRSLHARGLRPITVSNQDSQIYGNVESNESQFQAIAQEQSSQSSSFQASTPSIHPSAGNSPILHPEDDIPSYPAESHGRVGATKDVVSGIQSLARKKRKISHPGDQTSRADARRILESNPMFQLSPSPERSPSRLKKSHRKDKTRRPRFHLPETDSPPPLSTPVTSSIRRKPWRVISDDESSNDGSVPSPSKEPPELHPQGMGDAERTSSRPSSRDDNKTSPQAEPEKRRERAEIERYRKRLKGILPASWLRIDQQVKQPVSNSNSNRKNLSETVDKAADRKGVARPLPRSYAYTPGSTEARRIPTQDIIEVSDESGRDASPPTPLQHIDRRGPAWSSEGNAEPKLRIGDVEEDDWVDPMLPTASRPRKYSGVSRKRQTKLTDNFGTSTKPLVGERSSKSSADKRTYRTGATNRSGHANKHKQRPRSSPKRIPTISLLDVLDDESQNTERPDFLRVARRNARSIKHTGRQEPSRKQMYFRHRRDGHDAEQLLHAWRSGTIRPRLRIPSELKQSRRERPPLVEQENNNQHYTPAKFPNDQAKTPQAVPAHVKERRIVNAELHKPRLKQSTLKSSPSITNVNRGEFEKGNNGQAPKPDIVQSAQLSRAKPREHRRRGQLEELQSEEDQRHPQAAFRRNLLGLDAEPSRRSFKENVSKNPLLERYLHETGFEESSIDDPLEPSAIEEYANHRQVDGKVKKKLATRPRARKIQPVHVDTDDFGLYRGRADESAIADVLDYPSTAESQSLEGLAPPGHFYPVAFGVSSLPRGVYFHRRSFVGSGELENLMNIKIRDFDVDAGFATISFRGSVYKCGAWTEDVSSWISIILAAISRDFGRLPSEEMPGMSHEFYEVPAVLRGILRYFASHLRFSDAIDRKDFVGRGLTCVHDFLDELSSTMSSFRRTAEQQHVWMLGLSLWYAISQICYQDRPLSTLPDIRASNDKIVEILKANLMVSFNGLSDALNQQNGDTMREKGIQSGDEIETWCAVIEILHEASVPGMSFWDCFNNASNFRVPQDCNDVKQFESLWSDMFYLLPVHQLHSIVFSGKYASNEQPENWALVKRLITSTIDRYNSAGSQQPNINSYIRTLEGRCFNLVKHWHWQRPEPAMNCLFDFFAHRSLYLLSGEEPTDTNMLLGKINDGEHLQIHPSDHSFTLFLKLLRSSLLNMRQTYPVRKIRNITWRFVPNHGRIYRKEEDLRRDDLDALRNHHDLLSLLYASSPADARPKTTLIQNLVDLKSSHSEVCRLHIKTWANLVTFQLNTDESPMECESFSLWFNNIMHDLILQHRGARAEAEEMFQAANTGSVAIYSRKLVDKTVGSNERQIEALMSTALSCLKDTIEQASNEPAVRTLIEKVDFKQVFRLFDQKHSRLGTVIRIAVDVVQSYFKQSQIHRTRTSQQESNEDSQDYGGWPSDDEDELSNINHSAGDSAASERITSDVQQLLSNSFGADAFADHALLEKLTLCWVTVGTTLVQQNRHDWSYYLDTHAQGSWSQLLETENRTKFYSLYLANIIEASPSVLSDNLYTFLEGWLVSLVERESLMKYQHVLTASLLNGISEEPLLYNLPFESLNGQKYSVKLEDLKNRRTSLISSILGNMRHHLEECLISKSSAIVTKTRQNYAQMLLQMMSCMKKNYQALGTGSSVRGAYVEFVHNVVGCLQQYTTEICPIDKYFTDSAAFPLPANDPLYVVGRLRSYGVKPTDSRNQKKLAVFIQTVVERAVADGEQDYFTGQLVTAMNSENENRKGLASLRWLFIEAILPAYMDWMHSECGCLLALPVLASLPATLRQSLFYQDLVDIDSCTKLATTVLHCILQGIGALQQHTNPLHGPGAWALVYLLQALQASLPTLDHLSSSTVTMFLRSISNMLLTSDTFPAAALTDIDLSPVDSLITRYYDTENAPRELRTFAHRQLGESLSKNWTFDGVRYWVTQGNTRRSIANIPAPSPTSIPTTLTNLRHELTELLGDTKPYASGAAKVDFIDNLIV